MSNVQYEKITGSIYNLRKAYKNRRDEVVKELIESVAEIELSTHAMAERNEQDYLFLSIIKLHIEKIQELQSKMELLDDLKDKQKLIEMNFPVETHAVDCGENKIYWYTYRHRGFSLGSQPKDFIRHDGSVSKFGATAYRRPLTHDELVEYEMHLYKVEEGNNPAEWVK
ncbi:hypothetical protein ACW5UC_25435 [Priestia aryabhattai]|uniref:hypothetical protein n=1 Tax=Priestia megaterium TaxID=1404 RepID=UPI003F969973